MVGLIGYIFYWLLCKFVYFDGGFRNLFNEIKLVVYRDKNDLEWFKFRFLLV